MSSGCNCPLSVSLCSSGDVSAETVIAEITSENTQSAYDQVAKKRVMSIQ